MDEVLQIEIESILSWIDDQENDGIVQLQSFSWKSHSFNFAGDTGVYVIDHENAPTHKQHFDNWELALVAIKDRVLNRALRS